MGRLLAWPRQRASPEPLSRGASLFVAIWWLRLTTGVLAALAAKIAAVDTNISHVTVVERDDHNSTITFELQVRDRKHLATVIKAIRRMPDVLSVERTAS